MKRSIIIPIIIFIMLISGGALVFMNRDKDNTDDTMDMSSMSAESGDSANTETPADPNTVLISDFAYNPETITIKKGTTITWTNQDDARHDVAPTGGAADFQASELLAKGESYTFTFNTAGTYTYQCSPHPYMTGTVVVTE